MKFVTCISRYLHSLFFLCVKNKSKWLKTLKLLTTRWDLYLDKYRYPVGRYSLRSLYISITAIRIYLTVIAMYFFGYSPFSSRLFSLQSLSCVFSFMSKIIEINKSQHALCSFVLRLKQITVPDYLVNNSYRVNRAHSLNEWCRILNHRQPTIIVYK